MYPYGLIGNCHVSAHIHESGSVDWLCLPRPDSDPVFGRMLDPEGGHFSISSPTSSNQVKTTQRYLPNTNILVTEVSTSKGDTFKITDFVRVSNSTVGSIGPPPSFASWSPWPAPRRSA